MLLFLMVGIVARSDLARGQGLDSALPGDIPGFQVAPGLARITARRAGAQPLGFSWQSLLILPSIGVATGYYHAPGLGVAGSALLGVTPQMRFIDPIIGVAGVIRLNAERYARAPRQDTTDVTLALGWRVQAGPDRLDLGIARAVMQEDALGLAGGDGGVGNALPYQVQVRVVRADWRHHLGLVTLDGGLGATRSQIGSVGLAPGFRTATGLHGRMRAITTRHAPLRWVVQLDGRRTDYAGVLPGAPFGTTNALAVQAGVSTPRDAIMTLRALVGAARVRVAGAQHRGGVVPVFVLAAGWMPDRLSAIGLSVSRTDTGNPGLSLPGHPIERAGLGAALGVDRHWVVDAGLHGTQASVSGGVAREVAVRMGLRWRIGRMVTLAPHLADIWRSRVPGLAPHEFRAVFDVRVAP
ncbi:MAG: hypothetical protein B7Z67_06440 [Acidiphilium sp. 21-60-14]|nr:MAG: hypothetical protein B7Z67_06440 [Acidiphilium sp. 21-60-14]OYV92380.1 MAG: hypothetical protein B7Z57_01015 [Acidiphilium sp. 37-60-79]OZB40344.1 MAG: hypothetical protein B7X48_05455 [Acidiphilium sp. 34-60-192]